MNSGQPQFFLLWGDPPDLFIIVSHCAPHQNFLWTRPCESSYYTVTCVVTGPVGAGSFTIHATVSLFTLYPYNHISCDHIHNIHSNGYFAICKSQSITCYKTYTLISCLNLGRVLNFYRSLNVCYKFLTSTHFGGYQFLQPI